MEERFGDVEFYEKMGCPQEDDVDAAAPRIRPY